MKYFILFIACSISSLSQTNPIITSWMQNTTKVGSYYMKNNSTPISNNIKANVQLVRYSANNVYVSTNGIPTYPTGPFQDGNPSQAQAQNGIFRFPLKAVKNEGISVKTTMGNIGLFINGVALFDPRDGVSWNNAQQRVLGGPIMGRGDGIWNRDAIVAERVGFDCSKGHPAMGNYHHHQNPSAFKLDKKVIYDVCSLYDAEGIYAINPGVHSPLIGFAYDGFPVYGAYGYKNANGTGGIVRMQSGYRLRSISTRTHYADGSDVTDGPPVSTIFPLGYFNEDYEFISHPGEEDYLDTHNGRFCITPEYPNGTYAYFCTVDEQWNSAYPYAIGPTFYGSIVAAKVQNVTEPVETYTPTTSIQDIQLSGFTIFFAANDLLIIQSQDINRQPIHITLYNLQGLLIAETTLEQGSTIAHIDCSLFYDGAYALRLTSGAMSIEEQLIIKR